MAIHFRFRSSLCFDSVDIEGRSSISVRDLKSKIVLNKNLNICQDFDLVLCDAKTGQEYFEENFQIPSGSSVIIKRVPSGSVHSDMVRGFPVDNVRTKDTNVVETSTPMNVENDNFDDFGVDLCPIFGASISGSDLDGDKKLYFTNSKSDEEIARFLEMPVVGYEKAEASELSEAIPRGIDGEKDTSQMNSKPRVEELVKPERVVTANTVAIQSIDLPAELKCTLCNTCFKEAVMIPCCQHSFCEKCIRLVLTEKGRCPKCLSTKFKEENLLPNVSLRQAIEHFLESQILMTSTDKAFGYAPDGESGIQVKEMSCAASIQQRDEELSHSPCTTGRGSNQIIVKPINVNSSLSQKLKQNNGKKHSSTRTEFERRPENLVVEFQGENQPMHEEESTIKKKAPWIHSAGANRSFVDTGRQRKGDRTCYLCGSPDHFIRDCPAASSSYPMLHTGSAMFPGDVPGYLSPYWNRSPFPQMSPFPNPYGNPFNATMVPPTTFAVQSYMPSIFSSMPFYGGFPMMGGVASSVVPCAEWHQELQGHEKRQKISNNSSKRQQSFDDDDDDDNNIKKRHYYSESKRSHDPKAPRDRDDGLSHSRNSSTERPHGERHCSYFHDEPERSSSEVEDMPCNSNWHSDEKHKHHHRNSKIHDGGRKRRGGDSIRSYHESTRAKDDKIKRVVSDAKREKHKQNSHESTGAKDDKRNRGDGDSIHSYHDSARAKDDKTKRVLSDSKRGKNKQKRLSESGLEPCISSEWKTRRKERESSNGSRHSRHNSRSMNNEPSNERWQMASRSDEDGEDDYYHKRKRLQ
ncbi:E3 ubiquitin ligase PARAQUAT TOLERANCE 3-like isoform X2 [Euphorbia lathyris]|uniref:E3 ubiquitin ligase PARAQUAT TOLERANCE 3-like isoform X2 n=1 Tax=Euphorbia lathyris TaxID=212925 RepID=UPI0033138314